MIPLINSGAARGPNARAWGAPFLRKNGKGIELIFDGPNVPRDAPGAVWTFPSQC